jgi:hypothetical protein
MSIGRKKKKKIEMMTKLSSAPLVTDSYLMRWAVRETTDYELTGFKATPPVRGFGPHHP